jgi:hypothetical protein
VYRKTFIFTLENAMLKRRLQTAGGRVGDFFAEEYVLSVAEERKGPVLAQLSPVYTRKMIRGFV